MGISPFKVSRDSYPSISNYPGGVYQDNTGSNPRAVTNPNPDPSNYIIKKVKEVYNSVIILINYPNCTNYEGDEILVYYNKDNTLMQSLISQQLIDPHFSENEEFISPVARFEPTDRGWKFAVAFAEAMSARDQLADRGGNW